MVTSWRVLVPCGQHMPIFSQVIKRYDFWTSIPLRCLIYVSTIGISRKEQISSSTLQRNLKERKGANHQYHITLMIIFLHQMGDLDGDDRGRSRFTPHLRHHCACRRFFPWHVESAIISFFCLIYDPGIFYYGVCCASRVHNKNIWMPRWFAEIAQVQVPKKNM